MQLTITIPDQHAQRVIDATRYQSKVAAIAPATVDVPEDIVQ